jgi:hypothetical protein
MNSSPQRRLEDTDNQVLKGWHSSYADPEYTGCCLAGNLIDWHQAGSMSKLKRIEIARTARALSRVRRPLFVAQPFKSYFSFSKMS